MIFENFSQITSPSPSPSINNVESFIAGTYSDTEGRKYTLSGSAILENGRTSWALSSADDDANFSISWITGAAIEHPSVGPRDIAAELQVGFSYGVLGANNKRGSSEITGNWCQDGIIGAQQIGDNLALNRFHNDGAEPSSSNATINLIRIVP